MDGSSSFLLSNYLTVFLNRTGERATFFQSLDGQQLLPYQCVIQRDEWERVQEHFRRAYSLQKAAYRRSRGGTTAPSVIETTEPRFRDDRSLESLQQRCRDELARVKTVVRNTFVEMDECGGNEGAETTGKRHRTVSPPRRCLRCPA